MPTIIYAGDLHGRLDDIGKIIQSAEDRSVDAVVQVGDLGFGFPDKTTRKFMEKRARQAKWSVPFFTCLGNHDNWDLIYEMMGDEYPDVIELVPGSGFFYVTRGTTIDIAGSKHLFFGGATSTDAHLRKPGYDWWAGEEPTRLEFERFFDALNNDKPDTVVTHEAPIRVKLKRKFRNGNYVANGLENVIKLTDHMPKNWMFGHHHLLQRWKIDGVKYFCCGLHSQYWERKDFCGGWLKNS